ncbi:MAG: hypothetical protein ACJ8IK_16220 [Burkholderiaceae bacterium]
MDLDNAPEPALADGLAPSGAALAPSPRVRWRQRALGRRQAGPASEPEAPPGRGTLAEHAAPAMPAMRAMPSAPAAQGAPSGSNDAAQPLAAAAADTSCAHAGAARARATGVTAQDVQGVQGVNVTNGTDANAAGIDVDVDVGADADVDLELKAGAGASAEAEGNADADADADAHADANTDYEGDADSDLGGDAPQRAPRDIELWLLARRAQGAAVRLDFELRTALARQVFRRDFVYVSRQLHAIEASRRVQGLDRARLNDALATLRQRGEVIEAALNRRASELQAAIDAHGPASARIAFARPARFQATIVSPGAHRFLALLLRADETLARLEMAWLLGLVEPAARSALVSDCRRALLGFKDLACDQRRAVGLLVQEINAQRAPGGKTG